MPTKAELEVILRKAFVLYDVDKSGFLERGEIKNLLNDACAGLGAPPITDSLLDQII
jgi:Ca2+-binding EF-hand superfamily protein